MLPAVTAVQTTINFGKAMTVGHFIVVKAHDASGNIRSEYMQIGSLVSGTTYNVSRDLAGVNSPDDPLWASGTPYLLALGTTGSGRIELSAYDTPRISVIKQGATYNAQTELIRLGDLNGMPGVLAEAYGIYIGDASNYLKYDGSSYLDQGNGAGLTNIDGSHITTGAIDASVVNVTHLNASNITTGTLDASTITVTNLDASQITAARTTQTLSQSQQQVGRSVWIITAWCSRAGGATANQVRWQSSGTDVSFIQTITNGGYPQTSLVSFSGFYGDRAVA